MSTNQKEHGISILSKPANVKRKRITKVLSIIGIVLVLLVALMVLIRFYPYTDNFPGYPKITHTSSGANGDPLNMVLIGSQAQIRQSFQKAGWLIPDPITRTTSEKIAAASLAHRSYPTAPVSNLYVFGRVQDLAFEKPTNDVQDRGHIRLWQTGTTIGGQPVWIGQASYDRGIELSGTNHLPTHHIAPTVDVERNAVGADLEKTGLVKAEYDAAFTSPILSAQNGGGDFYESDGDVLVISYASVSIPISQQEWLIYHLKEGVFSLYDALLSGLNTIGINL
jgi:LssY-like putative type I secretion system component LssY